MNFNYTEADIEMAREELMRKDSSITLGTLRGGN